MFMLRSWRYGVTTTQRRGIVPSTISAGNAGHINRNSDPTEALQSERVLCHVGACDHNSHASKQLMGHVRADSVRFHKQFNSTTNAEPSAKQWQNPESNRIHYEHS
jgi:hypothetical protein